MTRRPYLSVPLAWLAGILILASGCMDQSPTATLLDPATVREPAQLPASVRPILASAPFAAGATSQVITPDGGSIHFGIGTITFPAGAVDRATQITAEVDGSSMAVAFGPHLVFSNAQPTLCFDVAGASLPDAYRVVHVKDDGSTETVPHVVTTSSVCVSVSSFSKYVLASY